MLQICTRKKQKVDFCNENMVKIYRLEKFSPYSFSIKDSLSSGLIASDILLGLGS